MNSSILVSGFVVVGVGAMAILFNPFGSSEDTPTTPTSAYQASTDLKASADSNKVSAPSRVSATSSDPNPFVWENQKETVASTGILSDIKNQSPAKKVAKATTSKAKKNPFGQRSLGSKASKDSTPKPQTVSKTSSNFGDQSASTADADLDSFFGSSKPKTKPATKVTKAPVAKAPKTKPAVPEVKTEPVRVASKPTVDTAKSSSSWPTQEVKASPKKDDDMFSFSPRAENGTDDAPMLAPVKSKDFDMPTIEPPVKEDKMASKTESSSQDFSGSFESVLTKPTVAGPVVREFNIKNPLQTRLTVTFLANGKKVTLKPGQHFKLRQTDDVQVKFSRGGSFGFAEKSLSEGDYQFSVTRKDGWKLAQ